MLTAASVITKSVGPCCQGRLADFARNLKVQRREPLAPPALPEQPASTVLSAPHSKHSLLSTVRKRSVPYAVIAFHLFEDVLLPPRTKGHDSRGSERYGSSRRDSLGDAEAHSPIGRGVAGEQWAWGDEAPEEDGLNGA